MRHNFQIINVFLKNLGRKTFKLDLAKILGSGRGKFLYKLFLNRELCAVTGIQFGVPLYIGKSTDLIDRLYRHFKGMCPEYIYCENMEKGKMLYDMLKALDAPQHILDNLYKYVDFEVDDITETDVNLTDYENENIQAFENRFGHRPILNKRTEPTINVSKTLFRKFFDVATRETIRE